MAKECRRRENPIEITVRFKKRTITVVVIKRRIDTKQKRQKEVARYEESSGSRAGARDHDRLFGGCAQAGFFLTSPKIRQLLGFHNFYSSVVFLYALVAKIF